MNGQRAGAFFGARDVFTKISAYLPYSPHVLSSMKKIRSGGLFGMQKYFHSVYCVFAFEPKRLALFCPHFRLEIRIQNENEFKTYDRNTLTICLA